MGIKFTVFSDLHYDQDHIRVEHVEEIIESAKSKDSQFVMHCGDLTRKWTEFTELSETLLNNKYGTKVYGTYGNHDTESVNNTFDYVFRATFVRNNLKYIFTID